VTGYTRLEKYAFLRPRVNVTDTVDREWNSLPRKSFW